MCEKMCYDKKTAETIVNHAIKQHKKWRREIRCYQCPDEECENMWHVTSKEEYEPPVKLSLDELKYAEKWKSLLE